MASTHISNSQSQTEWPPRSLTWGDSKSFQHHGQNVFGFERFFSIAAALGLGAFAVKQLSDLKKANSKSLAIALGGGALLARGTSGYCPAKHALGLGKEGATSLRNGEGIRIEVTRTINKDPQELYEFWRNFENLPRFMQHLEKVERINDTLSRWTARGPAGLNPSWEARIINEHPGEMIAWESIPGGWVDTAGSVHFKPAPGDRGTEVRVALKYNPPAGVIGHVVAKLFGDDPQHAIRSDLRRLQALLETGEAPTVEGQPHGARY